MADVLKNVEMSMNHSNVKILAYHHGFSEHLGKIIGVILKICKNYSIGRELLDLSKNNDPMVT